MAKVLVVTDYTGVLHITPVGNVSFYQNRNQVYKKQQYGYQQMEEAEALKYVEANKGRDPKFVKPAETSKLIASKDEEIEKLKAQLAALQKADEESQLTAKEVIEKIKAATTASEVQALSASDKRATVIAASAAKLEELKK